MLDNYCDGRTYFLVILLLLLLVLPLEGFSTNSRNLNPINNLTRFPYSEFNSQARDKKNVGHIPSGPCWHVEVVFFFESPYTQFTSQMASVKIDNGRFKERQCFKSQGTKHKRTLNSVNICKSKKKNLTHDCGCASPSLDKKQKKFALQ